MVFSGTSIFLKTADLTTASRGEDLFCKRFWGIMHQKAKYKSSYAAENVYHAAFKRGLKTLVPRITGTLCPKRESGVTRRKKLGRINSSRNQNANINISGIRLFLITCTTNVQMEIVQCLNNFVRRCRKKSAVTNGRNISGSVIEQFIINSYVTFIRMTYTSPSWPSRWQMTCHVILCTLVTVTWL